MMRRRFFKLAFITAIVCILIAIGLYGFVLWSYLKPSQNSRQVEVEIPVGASTREIATNLENLGVVRSAKVFEIFVRIKGEEKNIKAGLYEFKLPIRQSELLKKLVRGDVKLVKITIPEGLTIKEIDAILTERFSKRSLNPLSRGEFERAARSSPIAKKYGADTLEGFLFPDTYLVRHNITVEELISVMTRRFDAVFEPLRVDAEKRGMSVLEVVTLASIIEKETSVDAERPLISAVFHNRLKRGMRLQSDPTVIYGLKDFDGNLTKEHLQDPHPYNTYVYAGLPKGPICNPGKSPLVAALNPADVDYLYFVSKGDGTHFFSSDYPAHWKAVLKYQMKRAP